MEIACNCAKGDKRVGVVAAQHQGQTLTLKAAIAQTTGDYIGWVDSDDALAPTALEETTAVLDASPEVGLVYTDYMVIDEHGFRQRLRTALPPSLLKGSVNQISCGNGNDDITITMNHKNFSITLKEDPDRLNGDDVITLQGIYGNSVVDLASGNDRFNGGIGANNISGSDGNDIIAGGNGSDR